MKIVDAVPVGRAYHVTESIRPYPNDSLPRHFLLALAPALWGQSADSILLLDRTPRAIAADAQGNLLVAQQIATTGAPPIGVYRYSPNGSPIESFTAPDQTLPASGDSVILAADSQGAIYLGARSTLVRIGGPAWSPQLPAGAFFFDSVAFDPQNNPILLLTAAETPNIPYARILKLDRNTGQLLGAADILTASYPAAMAVDSAGAIYITGVSNDLNGFAAKIDATLLRQVYLVTLDIGMPHSIAVDSTGNAYIAETPLGGGGVPYFGTNRLYKLDSTGAVTATNAGGGEFVTLDGAGNLMAAGGSYPPTGALQAGCGPRNDLAGLSITSLDPVTLQPRGSALLAQQIYLGASEMLADGGIYVATASNRVLRVNPSSPSSPVSCISNGASFLVEANLEPGELVTIFGQGLGSDPISAYDESQQLPFASGGTEVRIGGYNAPLLAVSSTQINCAVPYELSPFALTASIEILRNGRIIYTWPMAIAVRSPAPLLSFDDKGSLDFYAAPRYRDTISTYPVPLAVARNADGSRNSAANPARLGSTVTILATGFGELGGASAAFDGQPGPDPPLWPAAYHPNVPAASVADIPVVTPYGSLSLGVLPITTVRGTTNAVLGVQATIPASFPAGPLPFVIGPATAADPVWTNYIYVAK